MSIMKEMYLEHFYSKSENVDKLNSFRKIVRK